MRLFYAVAGMVALLGTVPAAGAQLCTCIGGYVTSGGAAVCTSWDCQEALVSAPQTPVRNVADCPDSRMLVCENQSCQMVCVSGDQITK